MKLHHHPFSISRKGITKGLWILLLIIFILSSCSPVNNCDPEDATCTRVLFLGNSYTFVNDLPATFAKLAKAGRYQVEVAMSAQGGWTLADHVQSTDTLNLLKSTNWNFVVLQEQSEIPSVRESRTYSMYPAARTLVQQIRDTGATPVFFLTWAHRDGFPENGMNDYKSMQYQINNGYYWIAKELNAAVAPVGSAWLTETKENPELLLWQEDGSHPTEEGTYLAACVFFATIFQESPIGLKYRAGLSKEVALTLQTVAARTALNLP